MFRNIALLVVAAAAALIGVARGHARLLVPPGRSSLWRHGFNTPVNYDDDGQYCGGFDVQWKVNGGKCGLCGDPYHQPRPRNNEVGGKYGLNVIGRKYVAGEVLDAAIDILANHRGFFEFRLCKVNDLSKEATQSCLDENPLQLTNGKGTSFNVTDIGNGLVVVPLRLPIGLTCERCVLQWTYRAGNNWGKCDDGQEALGCGPQETFRSCADITIVAPCDADSNSQPGKAATYVEPRSFEDDDILIPLYQNTETDHAPQGVLELYAKISRSKLSLLSGQKDVVETEDASENDEVGNDLEVADEDVQRR